MSKISQDIVLYTRNYRTSKTEAGRYPNLLHAVNLRPDWNSKEALFHHIKVGERERELKNWIRKARSDEKLLLEQG